MLYWAHSESFVQIFQWYGDWTLTQVWCGATGNHLFIYCKQSIYRPLYIDGDSLSSCYVHGLAAHTMIPEPIDL